MPHGRRDPSTDVDPSQPDDAEYGRRSCMQSNLVAKDSAWQRHSGQCLGFLMYFPLRFADRQEQLSAVSSSTIHLPPSQSFILLANKGARNVSQGDRQVRFTHSPCGTGCRSEKYRQKPRHDCRSVSRQTHSPPSARQRRNYHARARPRHGSGLAGAHDWGSRGCTQHACMHTPSVSSRAESGRGSCLRTQERVGRGRKFIV